MYRDRHLLIPNKQILEDGLRLTTENPLLLSAKSLNLTSCEPDLSTKSPIHSNRIIDIPSEDLFDYDHVDL